MRTTALTCAPVSRAHMSTSTSSRPTRRSVSTPLLSRLVTALQDPDYYWMTVGPPDPVHIPRSYVDTLSTIRACNMDLPAPSKPMDYLKLFYWSDFMLARYPNHWMGQACLLYRDCAYPKPIHDKVQAKRPDTPNG